MTDKKIKPTCDRKTRFYKTQQNTFGLLPGSDKEGTCPGATTAPGGCWWKAPGRKTCICYVDGLLRAYKNIRGTLEHNTLLLKDATQKEQVQLLNDEFVRFRQAEFKRNKRTGEPVQLHYRLHWSGDIFDYEYAHSIAQAVKQHKDISFWCYTRTFFAVPILNDIPNLNLYLSLDPVNVQPGLLTYNRYKTDTLQVCYMSDEQTFDEHCSRTKTILEQENTLKRILQRKPDDLSWLDDCKLINCPVDVGTLNLEEGCAKCKNCIRKPPKPVWFKS